jgi:predicted O-methyltransferase YrrM
VNARGASIERELLDRAPDLAPKSVQVLADMYGARALRGTEQDVPVKLEPNTRISIEQGAELHRIARAHRTKTSLEIGFAYGFSTIWLLDALSVQVESSHLAIDPLERGLWQGVGLRQVERVSELGPTFGWVEDYSIHALSQLIRQKRKFDLVFIDGNHRFDDVLVDFYLADQVLAIGGIMAFDDLWMQSVRSVVSFVSLNRDYRLVEQRATNMAVFRKLADDRRPWHHFRRFETDFAPLDSLSVRALRNTESILRRVRSRLGNVRRMVRRQTRPRS